MTTIAARWFYQGRNGKTPRLIVMHCTVSPEMGTGAEDVARYFANLPATNKASAHKVVDDDSIVTCVDDNDTAFAAAGANSDGLHLELVGQPTQTREEWLDQFSTHEMAKAQTVVDEWSGKYAIPLRWLTVAEVADGVTRGMCTHADVSAAFPKVSTGHWDPGPNFPKDKFPAAGRPPTQEDDIVRATYMRPTDDPGVALVFETGAIIPVNSFDATEEVFVHKLGVEIITYSKTERTPDSAGTVRDVWVVDDLGLGKAIKKATH